MKKILVCGIFLLAAFAFSAESFDLSARAERSLQKGKFAKAYGLYERALLSSRKESDIASEGRILIAMANLRTLSLDLEFAEDLLGQVRKDDLDSNALAAYRLAWMELFLERGDYAKVIEIKHSVSNAFLGRIPDALRGSILCAGAVAWAGSGNDSAAKNYLEDADNALDGDSPGRLAFAKARVASLLGDGNADSLYGVALERSVRAGRPFMSATILYYRAENEKRPEIAKDYFRRSANAFDLMGLSRNKERSASHGN